MTNRQIIWGDPTSPGGAKCIAQNSDDLLQMAVEFEYLRLFNDNTPITPLLNTRIHDRAKREQMLLNHKLSSLGLPQNLKTLLETTSKSDVEKYCRNLQLSEFELFLLVHNCEQISFNHHSRFQEHVPDDRAIADSDRENLNKDDVHSFRKLFSVFQFRMRSHIHLFGRGSEWHLFYYTYRDIDEKEKSHWKGGPHLHYISHLWTHYEKDKVLTLFDKRRSDISGYSHIRFSPFKYPKHTQIPVTTFGSQPMLLAINSDLPSDPNSNPIPTAHVATRGIWITSISIV